MMDDAGKDVFRMRDEPDEYMGSEAQTPLAGNISRP